MRWRKPGDDWRPVAAVMVGFTTALMGLMFAFVMYPEHNSEVRPDFVLSWVPLAVVFGGVALAIFGWIWIGRNGDA